jgi:hypothetical protein|tara:strand:+ start:849 stop:1169 length:321 start_codon:yes stop_codon:yes gene_type:complete
MRYVIIVAAVVMTGCSAAPKIAAQKPQYCHTSQTIQTQNGSKVDSKTVVECTDDQIKRVTISKVGIGNNCGYFNGWMKKGGKDVQYRAISCQLPDGSWEIVNPNGS